MSADTDDEFQKELIALFVQEAQEWLQQIHVALDELQQEPPADRHLKLAHTIKAGLTNLGGSAATINLQEIEQASFSGLSLVHAVENPSLPPSGSAFLALCKQLGVIHDALTRATGVTFQAEPVPEEAVAVTVQAQEFLAALQGMYRSLAGTTTMPCHVTKTIIAQIDSMTKSGVTHCDVTSLRDVLERGAQAEQALVQAVHQLGPLVADGIRTMGPGSIEQDAPSDERQRMIARAGELRAAAQQVNAVEAMTFFAGLQSFLTLVSDRRVLPAAQQFEKVEARLRAMPSLIQEWTEAGQLERAAIEALLPAGAV